MAAPKFRLRPMSVDDVRECARIAGLAFQDDRHTQFKAARPSNPYNHEEGMIGALQSWVARSPGALEATVAVDSATEQILGWVVWGFRGFLSTETVAQTTADHGASAPGSSDPQPQSVGSTEGSIPPQQSFATLEEFTSDDFAAWMKAVMPPGTKCMYIMSIIVHPDFKGKGVGTALGKKGTDQADKNGVFCWVHSSEAGKPLFDQLGFQVIRKLEIHLDDWNTEGTVPPEGKGNWGTYTFAYMKKVPGGPSRSLEPAS